MELTDAQVLTQLKLRRVRLKLELDRVEIGIKAFERVMDMTVGEALPHLMDDYANNEELLQSVLIYNSNISAPKKVLYVLSKIGQGDATDISEYLIKIDPNVKDFARVYKRITYVSSRLFKTGVITAVRDGKRNLYRLK